MSKRKSDARCCKQTWYRSGGAVVCSNPAKAEREGKLYCGIHDPVRLKAKKDAQYAKWNAKLERIRAQDAAAKLQRQKAEAFDWLDAHRGNVEFEDGMFWGGPIGKGSTLLVAVQDAMSKEGGK